MKHLLAVICAIGLIGQVQAQTEVQLRPVFVQGQSATYELWSQREQTATISNGQEEQSFTTVIEFEGQVTWSVQSVRSNGSAECVLEYDWVKITLTGPEGEVMENDSRRGSGDEPGVHAMTQAIAGRPLTVDVQPDGTVRSVDGISAIQRELDDPESAPEEREFIATAEELALLAAAPATLSAGRGWTHGYDLPHELGEIRYDHSYTLDGVSVIENVPVATLTYDAEIDFTPDMSDVPPGVQVDVRMTEAESQGMVLFDLDRKETVGRHGTQHTRIEVVASAGGQRFVQTVEERRQEQALRISEE